MSKLHQQAGAPSLRAVARVAFCSHTSVAKALGPCGSSSWSLLSSVAGALGASPVQMEQLKEAWREETANDVGNPIPSATVGRWESILVVIPVAVGFLSIDILSAIGPRISIAAPIKAATLGIFLVLILSNFVVRETSGLRPIEFLFTMVPIVGLFAAAAMTVAELYAWLPPNTTTNYLIGILFTIALAPFVVARMFSVRRTGVALSRLIGLGGLVMLSAMSIPAAAVGGCNGLTSAIVPPAGFFAIVCLMAATATYSVVVGYGLVPSLLLTAGFLSVGVVVFLNVYLQACNFGSPASQYSVPTSAILSMAAATAFLLSSESALYFVLPNQEQNNRMAESVRGRKIVIAGLAVFSIALYSLALAANGASGIPLLAVTLAQVALVPGAAYVAAYGIPLRKRQANHGRLGTLE